MLDYVARQWARAQIRPYTLTPHSYHTGWMGIASFEQIYFDLSPNFKRLLHSYGCSDFDVADVMGHGFMRLLQDLRTEPMLLNAVDKSGALRLLLCRANTNSARRLLRHEFPIDALYPRSEESEDQIDGARYAEEGRWAGFSELVDLRIDLENAIRDTAQAHMHSLTHLVALYYITTSVSPEAAARIVGKGGTKRAWWSTNVVRPVRVELLDRLGYSESDGVNWKHKFFIEGIEAPLYRLMDRHEANGNLRMVATLQSLTKGEPTRVLAKRLNLTHTATNYYRAQAWRELNRIYRCRLRAAFFYR